MARKKKEPQSNTETKAHSLGDDLTLIKLPFKLFSGFSAVIEELEQNDFEYQGIYDHINSTFLFKAENRKEYITVNVSEENLLIKQFSENEDKDKLKVIYVVKDSGRKFKIL
jgi:hypothetical protein